MYLYFLEASFGRRYSYIVHKNIFSFCYKISGYKTTVLACLTTGWSIETFDRGCNSIGLCVDLLKIQSLGRKHDSNRKCFTESQTKLLTLPSLFLLSRSLTLRELVIAFEALLPGSALFALVLLVCFVIVISDSELETLEPIEAFFFAAALVLICRVWKLKNHILLKEQKGVTTIMLRCFFRQGRILAEIVRVAHDPHGKVRHRTGQSQRRDVIMYIVYICISELGQKKMWVSGFFL